ncbi:MAG: RES family NAD+ phosphorylase [Acidimicrobiales bacterium]
MPRHRGAASSVTQATPALGPPPEPDHLRRFPVWHVLAGTVLHRVTRAEHGPWWFSSDGAGRFDLPAPRGTCYLADDPVLALFETLGATASAPVLAPSVVEDRRVWSVPLPDPCDAADTTVRRARAFGVTAELATITPHGQPQAWASAFRAAAFGGIRYRARHDPAGGRCLALFGRAGERRSWRRGQPAAVGPALGDRFLVEAGIRIAAVPRVDHLANVLD